MTFFYISAGNVCIAQNIFTLWAVWFPQTDWVLRTVCSLRLRANRCCVLASSFVPGRVNACAAVRMALPLATAWAPSPPSVHRGTQGSAPSAQPYLTQATQTRGVGKKIQRVPRRKQAEIQYKTV